MKLAQRIECTYTEAKQTILELIHTKEYAIANGFKDEVLSPLIWGEPGLGKSAMIKEIGQENSYEIVELRGSYLEPTDLIGIPYPDVKNKVAKWLQSELIPFNHTGKGLLFLDEINRAPPTVLNALMELTLDRRVKGEYIPDGWQVIAAANPDTDNSGVEAIPDALRNRFTHLYVRPDHTTFINYLTRADANVTVRAFLTANPQMVYQKNSSENNLSDVDAYPTYRSWSSVSEYCNYIATQRTLNVSEIPKKLAISGMIGVGAYALFNAFAELAPQLPDIDAILNGKKNIDVPTKRDVAIYTAISLIDSATPKNIEHALNYLDRMEQEVNVVGLSTLKNRKDKHLFIMLPAVQKKFEALAKLLF